MDPTTLGQKTFLELIEEITSIIDSGRYDIPDLIKTELKAAKVMVSAADESFIGEMLNTLALYLIPFEKEVDNKNVDFFKHIEEQEQGQQLKEMDSKTFNAIKYIVEQASDGGEEELEDIDVLFDFMITIKEIVKKHKGR